MRTLFNLTCLLEKPQKRSFALFALLSLLSPAVDLFVVSRLIPMIQQVFNPASAEKTISQIAFLALVFLLVGILNLLKNYCSTAFTMDTAHDWSLKIYELFVEENLEEHNRKTVAQATSSVRTDPSVCAGMMVSYVNLFVSALTAAAYSVILIYIAQGVGVFTCLLTAGFTAALHLFTHAYIVRCGEKKRQLEINAMGLVSTGLGSYKEIRVDSRKSKLVEKYRGVSERCVQAQKKYMFFQSMQGTMLIDFMKTALLLLLAFVIVIGMDLSVILPKAVIYITLLTQLLAISHQVASSITSLQYAYKYYEEFQAIMEQYRTLCQKRADQARLRKKQVTLKRGIRVENLSFHYPNGKQIFENASIDIPAGHSVAIVGPSGEGKTTFLDLILGLLHPQSGHIWYDDLDIVEEKDSQGSCLADIGNVVSYIPQTVYLNDDTIRSNVAFMVDEDEERLIECLKYAQIWEDIRKMPNGLDTIIGRNGVAISGGQRQRIALARALYKQFEILIMDEATAALDVETECAVIDSIRKMRKDKTVLLVTHHLNLANECEYVYRLENRKLVRLQ